MGFSFEPNLFLMIALLAVCASFVGYLIFNNGKAWNGVLDLAKSKGVISPIHPDEEEDQEQLTRKQRLEKYNDMKFACYMGLKAYQSNEVVESDLLNKPLIPEKQPEKDKV